MKIVREASVYLVGKPGIEHKGFFQFVADETDGSFRREMSGNDAEKLCETAGRVCYMSFDKPRPGGNKAYLEHILEVGHGNLLEHAVWNFIFTGVSRSLSHELVRHRAGWSYSQLSQRYVDESVAEYVEPDCIAEDPELHELWKGIINAQHQAYCKLAKRLFEIGERRATNCGSVTLDREQKTAIRKEARQAARSVLPNATETKIFVTANARALRHFIEMRGSRHADVEIRKLAIKVLKIMQQEAPNLFGDYVITPLPDGTEEASTKWKKV